MIRFGVFIITGNSRRSSHINLAGLTFFGVTHSASPDGQMYLPWTLVSPLARTVAYQFTLGYLALAGVLLILSLTRESRERAPADHV